MQLSPDYALASFQLGLAYARMGDFDHAIDTLNELWNWTRVISRRRTISGLRMCRSR